MVEDMLEQLDRLSLDYTAACKLDAVKRLHRAIEVYKDCQSLIDNAETLPGETAERNQLITGATDLRRKIAWSASTWTSSHVDS